MTDAKVRGEDSEVEGEGGEKQFLDLEPGESPPIARRGRPSGRPRAARWRKWSPAQHWWQPGESIVG